MDTAKIMALPIAVQLSLGVGYLAYCIGYAGLRRGHTIADASFMSLAFSLMPLLIFNWMIGTGNVVAGLVAAIVGLLCGMLWRAGGRRLWSWLMDDLGVHGDDGLHTAWETVIQQPGLKVQQVAVLHKDGRKLLLSERGDIDALPHRGLILGADGSVVMMVQEEVSPDGSRRQAEGVITANGARLTYIPADEVRQISLRIG